MRQVWDITGTILLDEAAQGVRGTFHLPLRPIAGLTLAITSWPDARACAAIWGEVITDERGGFRLRTEQPEWAHEIGVAAHLADGRWLRVFASRMPLEGPLVPLGPVVVRPRSAAVRQALLAAPHGIQVPAPVTVSARGRSHERLEPARATHRSRAARAGRP